MPTEPTEKKLAHIVFFTLKDGIENGTQNLLAACEEYLAGHDGVEYYSAGSRCEELDRPVNDQEFHVALHVVFESKEAHDAYQTHPRHLEFIESQKATWKQVRVFDSFV